MTERMTVLLARSLQRGDRIEADDTDTVMEGRFMNFDEIDKMIDHHEIDDSQTVTGLYLVRRWLDSN